MPESTIGIGDDVEVAEDANGNAVLRHKDTGNEVSLASDGTFSSSSVSTDQLSNVPAEGVSQSLYSTLSQGYATALVPGGGFKTVSFASFATDDAALQALVDWIEANHPNGAIYAPVVTDEGTELTIENTVATDTTLATGIDWYFIGGGENQDGTKRTSIKTTINDGSYMFDLGGEIGGSAPDGLQFYGKAWTLGGQDANLVRFRNVNKQYVELGTVRDFIGDCITFGTGCFVYRVQNTNFVPIDRQTDSNGNPAQTARCIVTQDNETNSGVSPGSDGVIMPNVSCEIAHDVGVANLGGHSRLSVGGHWEGAHGLAEIQAELGPRNAGSTYIGPMATIAVTKNGAHGVYHNGGAAVIRPQRVKGQDGDGIHIGLDTGPFTIGSEIAFGGITGDAINIEATPSNSVCVAPYENTVNGTTTYTSTPRSSLRYPDGWVLQRTGTTTVLSSSTATANSFGGNDNYRKRAEITHASAPAGDTTYRYYWGVDASNNHTTLELENLGANDVDLSWAIYKRA